MIQRRNVRSRVAGWQGAWLLLAACLLAFPAGAREYRESTRVQNISAEEVLEFLIDGNGPLVVDARGAIAYEKGHIPGAWDVNAKDIWGWVPDLEAYKDRGIVFYCNSGLKSRRAANKLLIEGFRKVFVMQGNFKRWRKLGYPLEYPDTP